MSCSRAASLSKGCIDLLASKRHEDEWARRSCPAAFMFIARTTKDKRCLFIEP
jgi:hypothetical protein